MYILVRSLLGHNHILHSLSYLCLGVEKKIVKEIHQFNTFYAKIISPFNRDHENYIFLSPYLTDTTYKDVNGRCMTETDDRRRTTTDANPSQ